MKVTAEFTDIAPTIDLILTISDENENKATCFLSADELREVAATIAKALDIADQHQQDVLEAESETESEAE